MPRHTALLLAACLALSACDTWPDEIGGGMAETADPGLPPALAHSATKQHLDCSLTGMRMAAGQVARDGKRGGELAELELTAARAQRELAGHMPGDAERSLTQLDQGLAQLGSPPPAMHGGQCAA